jgi:serine/threonine-protein kinase
MAVAVGDRIADRYRIEAWLGQGNMAVVYRAKHEGTGRQCALKLVHAHLAARQDIIDLFLREAQVGSRIGQSPYIVDVLDAGMDQARALPFLAMELLQGQTLDAQVRDHGPLDPATFRTLFEQLAEALDQAHAAGVIHRDLKPGNLFLTRNKKGQPSLKIVDFGIAKVLEQEAQRTATQVGSPAYASPEQMGPTLRRLAERQGITIAHGVSPATDVWALGLIAYELLTGLGGAQYWNQFDTINDLILRVVFEEPEPATVRAGPRSFLLPPGFDGWLAQCLKKNAAERWASAGEAVRELLRLMEGAALDNLPTMKLPSRAEIEALVGPAKAPPKSAPLPSNPDSAQDSETAQWRRPQPDTVRLTPEMMQGTQQPATAPLPPGFLPPPAPKPSAPSTETQPPGLVAPDAGVAGTLREPAKEPFPPRRAFVAAALLGVAFTVLGLLVLWPTSGSLRISVRTASGAPVERAEIFIDGQKRCDRAPCEVGGLSPGAKTIKAITPDLTVAEPITEIVEGGSEKAVTLTLDAARTTAPQDGRAEASPPPSSPGEPPAKEPGSPGDPKQPLPPVETAPSAPGTPPTALKAPESGATLNINSIPVSKVLLNGRPLGNTPKIGVPVPPGLHRVEFIHRELGRKSVSVIVKAGETKTAAVKFK